MLRYDISSISIWHLFNICVISFWCFSAWMTSMIETMRVGLTILCCWFNTKRDSLIYENSSGLWRSSSEISFCHFEYTDQYIYLLLYCYHTNIYIHLLYWILTYILVIYLLHQSLTKIKTERYSQNQLSNINWSILQYNLTKSHKEMTESN